MERWNNRVALVTGASSGIGAAVARALVIGGMKVVGVARRVDMVKALNDTELRDASGKLYPLECDVMQEKDILKMFEWIRKNLGGVDVLVNNAGIGSVTAITGDEEGSITHWRQIWETNVLAMAICSREAVKCMRERGVDDGHIININSIAGHKLLRVPGCAMYCASKHAVTALTQGLTEELREGTHIKTTSLSPGFVRTEILNSTTLGPQLYDTIPCLDPKDIADGVVFILGTPPNVQISEMIIKPMGENCC